MTMRICLRFTSASVQFHLSSSFYNRVVSEAQKPCPKTVLIDTPVLLISPPHSPKPKRNGRMKAMHTLKLNVTKRH